MPVIDPTAQLALATFFAVVMLAAAIGDLRRMRIANRLPLALLLGWPAFALALGLEGAAMLASVAVALGLLGAGFLCFVRGWLGAGDVKLAAAVALWLGPAGTAQFLLLASLLGAVLALVLVILRRAGQTRLLPDGRLRRRAAAGVMPVPYGVALALAALIVFAEPAALLSI